MLIPEVGRIGGDTVMNGRIPLGDEVRLSGPGAWAIAQFDAFGRGTGDPIVIVGPGHRMTVRPGTWTGGADVSER